MAATGPPRQSIWAIEPRKLRYCKHPGHALQLANTTTGSDGDWTTGNIPANCSGTVVLVWDLTNAEPVTLGETFARFRITTDRDSDFFTTDGPAPFGFAEDGEVEDYVITAGTLPVSISGFETRKTREGLEVSWSTVSETENVGFYLWNYAGGELELLTPDMIPSKTGDAAHPQDYSYTIPRSQGSNIGSWRSRRSTTAARKRCTAVRYRCDLRPRRCFHAD